MAETNEYELQALWWKRVLSAFTKRHDPQEIPYVLELLRCVGDQRATETAHRAWLLTRRDRTDAFATCHSSQRQDQGSFRRRSGTRKSSLARRPRRPETRCGRRLGRHALHIGRRIRAGIGAVVHRLR